MKQLPTLEKILWFLDYDKDSGNPNNNRISNLRDVDNRANQQNRTAHRNGKLVGASFHKKNNKWVSKIVINKKGIYLGCFDTELEAHLRYVKEVEKLIIGV